MERKVRFIGDAGNFWGGWTTVQRLTSSGKVSFHRQREGLHVETAQSALTIILKLAWVV